MCFPKQSNVIIAFDAAPALNKKLRDCNFALAFMELKLFNALIRHKRKGGIINGKKTYYGSATI